MQPKKRGSELFLYVVRRLSHKQRGRWRAWLPLLALKNFFSYVFLTFSAKSTYLPGSTWIFKLTSTARLLLQSPSQCSVQCSVLAWTLTARCRRTLRHRIHRRNLVEGKPGRTSTCTGAAAPALCRGQDRRLPSEQILLPSSGRLPSPLS